MGKAATKRNRGQKRYLANIAATSPEVFAEKWERRIDSWLQEIKLSIAEWKFGGPATQERIFTIVDAAMATLSACGPEVYSKYARKTYDALSNECCTGVAGMLAPRLYKLSNFDSLRFNSRKGKDGYILAPVSANNDFDQENDSE